VCSGVLNENASLLLGPADDGTFREVVVKTIHCKRVAVDKCEAGDSCALSIKAKRQKEQLKRSHIRRVMVLVSPAANPIASRSFEAEVLVLHHPTTIKMAYQAVIHCGIIRQTAAIQQILNKDCLRTGDKALVRFRFMMRPEYIHPNSVFIFREGSTKGIGKITKVLYDSITNGESTSATTTPVTTTATSGTSASSSSDDKNVTGERAQSNEIKDVDSNNSDSSSALPIRISKKKKKKMEREAIMQSNNKNTSQNTSSNLNDEKSST